MKKKNKEKKKSEWTRKELEELMGVNRDTYKRKNGAIRKR